MNRIFYLVLLTAFLIGFQPLFAQETEETVIIVAEEEVVIETEDAEITDETVVIVIDETIDTGDGVEVEETIVIAVEEITIETEDGEITETVIVVESTETTIIAEDADAVADDEDQPITYDVPSNLRNNQFFLESQRLARLAEETYEYGDYDSSADFAYEAIHYALLSDVFVAIAVAKSRIDWAVSSGASKQYPTEFGEAEAWYEVSLSARDAEEWEDAIDAAHKVIALLAYIGAPDGRLPLPATYTVREWVTFRDCLWNIAGRSWVYGNPREWRRLYDANRSKLPDPNNPNLIEPGMVLTIPSIRGETRQGEWSSGKNYQPLQ